MAPANNVSSRLTFPFHPAQMINTLLWPKSKYLATDERLRKDPMIIFFAPFAFSMASVPFVVVKAIFCSSISSPIYSKGEFPLSNPATFLPSRSPEVINPFVFIALHSSRLEKGVMLPTPCAKAVTMHELARRISTTTTVRSLTSYKCIKSGLRQTSRVLIDTVLFFDERYFGHFGLQPFATHVDMDGGSGFRKFSANV